MSVSAMDLVRYAREPWMPADSVDAWASEHDAEVVALRESAAHFQTSTAKYMEEAMALRARVAALEADREEQNARMVSPEVQAEYEATAAHTKLFRRP